MRDEQDRATEVVPHVQEPLVHGGAGERVKRSEGLVKEEHALVTQDCSHKGGALAHPPGKGGRIDVFEAF